MRLNKIAIHGVPRSGTTWLGSIFDSSKEVIYRNQPLFSYAFKSYLSGSSSKERINSFFDLLVKSEDDFILQKEGKINGLIPEFTKNKPSHIIYKEARYHNVISNLLKQDNELKVIGIIRNPKSVISSWLNAPKEFKREKWQILEEWKDAPSKNKGALEEFYGYNKWKEVAQLFLSLKEQYPNRFYLVNYKDLLNNTEGVIRDVFRFCHLDFKKQTKEFLQNSKKKNYSNNPYSVYRINQVDDKWKKNLSKEIIYEIDNDLIGTNLEKYLF